VVESIIEALRPEEIFYADVDPQTAQEAVGQLGLQSFQSVSQPLTKAAWRTIPSTYIICEQDAAIPVFAQEAMSQRAQKVLRMDTSHSPFLSRPAELAELLRKELTAARG
jgi:pimeloyl-ACP methyl ester carboxylesterase